MAEATAALGSAMEGRGGFVMLVGEPGIGKTRLAEELAVLSSDRSPLVAWGACYESRKTRANTANTAVPVWTRD